MCQEVVMALKAYLRGKLPELENKEDYLTSCVFEYLSLLPISYLRDSILRSSINLLGNNINIEPKKIKYYYWPCFPLSKYYKCLNTEPDIVLIVDGVAIIIEAKLLSSKSGVGLVPADTSDENEEKQEKERYILLDQLARQYLVGKELVANHLQSIIPENITDFYVLYLTADSVIPESDIIESIESVVKKITMLNRKEVKAKLYWTNWQCISIAIEENPTGNSDLEKQISDRLYCLLEANNLVPFKGFSFVDNIKASQFQISGDNLFYEFIKERYFLFLKNMNKKFILNNEADMFYTKTRALYWQNVGNNLDLAVINSKKSIFYKGGTDEEWREY